MSAKPKPSAKPTASGQTISLNEVADRYLKVYQRLFDIAMINMAGSRKVNEEDYEGVTNQFPVQPQQKERRDFEAAKDEAFDWLCRGLISEALSTVVPLMEDCRTVLALCDYKAAGKNDPDRIKQITETERREFMTLPIPDKFKHLKEKFEVESELETHILSLMDMTKTMIMFENKVPEDLTQDGKLTIKFRTITLAQAPVQSQEGGEPILGLTRKMDDHIKEVEAGQSIHLNKGELVGGLVTVAGFLATMLGGVQKYAQKTGAADKE